jgi:hypothetical protein
MKHRNLIPKICVAALVPAVLYFIAIFGTQALYSTALGDWAFGPGIVTTSIIWQVLPGLAVVCNILVAIHRAAARKDHVWLIASCVLWPMSFWYTLVETRADANNSFKPNPLRGSA